MMNTLAERLTRLAAGLEKDIEHKRRPMTQNPTPKRQREYRSRLWEAENDDRARRALLALAAAHEAGNVPAVLADVTTKAAVYPLVHKGLKSGGYYEVIPDDTYRDTSDRGRALQALLEGATTPEERAAHEERARQQTVEQMIDRLRFADYPGFFPTPAPLVERMLAAADIEPGMTVLEPSAGIGHIADAIRAQCPGAKLVTNEIIPGMVEILKAKGHDARHGDFLEMTGQYDRIIQNPPFERLADVDHVRHAFDLLKPGGRLVSLMSAGAFTNGQRKGEQFREWFAGASGLAVDMGDKSFAGAEVFRQTGVRVNLVILNKSVSAVTPAVDSQPLTTKGANVMSKSKSTKPAAAPADTDRAAQLSEAARKAWATRRANGWKHPVTGNPPAPVSASAPASTSASTTPPKPVASAGPQPASAPKKTAKSAPKSPQVVTKGSKGGRPTQSPKARGKADKTTPKKSKVKPTGKARKAA